MATQPSGLFYLHTILSGLNCIFAKYANYFPVQVRRQQQLSQILRQLLPKKLRNYLPGFVQSLLAKHNSLSNSRHQQYNSGSDRQLIHPHKPAAMRARRHNIPHNHGK